MNTVLVNENFRNNWVNRLLMVRGVAIEDIASLKHPNLSYIQEPEMLENNETAALEILQAVKNNKHIGLIIDSDCDGITSATIMYLYLHEINPAIQITYFFHSHKQHGLEDCWENFIEAGVDMVIEVDAGINDRQYHDLLGDANIRTIVGDHHIYEGGGFSEHAIYVDNQCSPNYKNKSLAGCGISWQMCRMIDKLNNTNYAFKYIDLVALGCCADVMSPLTLENRAIFDYGFMHPEHKMLLKLLDKQDFSMKGVVNYTSVAFYIAPLINATMRTGEPEEKLLMYKSFLHPDRKVESHKRGAKGEMVSITEEAARVLANVKARQGRLIEKYEAVMDSRIHEEGLLDNNVILIRLHEEDDFTSELNGLIATKISNQYHKPCYILRDGSDNLTKGSGRNPSSSPIDKLKEFVEQCPYVEQAIGHSSAHGCYIKTPYVNKFVEWFNENTKNLDFNSNSYTVNFEVQQCDTYLADLCWDVARHDYLWGGDNPQPIVSLQNIYINTKDIKIVGNAQDTARFMVNGVLCVRFKDKEFAQFITDTNNILMINCIGRPNINVWNGNESIQLLIDDIEYRVSSPLDF